MMLFLVILGEFCHVKKKLLLSPFLLLISCSLFCSYERWKKIGALMSCLWDGGLQKGGDLKKKKKRGKNCRLEVRVPHDLMKSWGFFFFLPSGFDFLYHFCVWRKQKAV